MSKLIIRYPNNVIKEVEFDKPQYKVGRAEDNDLVLEHEEVSPHQAEIDTANDVFSIIDVSENKSTTVNGKKIERTNLNYGDRIAFGPVIGLFYPSQKTKVAPKAKLAIYIAAGAFIIIFSIVLMLYLTSRRITTVMTTQIGGVIAPEKPAVEKIEKRKAEKPSIGGETAAEKAIWQAPLEEAGESGKQPVKAGAIVLPEPAPDAIAERTAIAIPRGIGRLLYKKIQVPVALTLAEETEPASLETAQGEAIESPAREAAEGEPLRSAEEEEAGGEAEPEAGKKGGFLAKVAFPVSRLFGGRREEPAAEEGAPFEEVSAPEAPSARELPALPETAAEPLPAPRELPEAGIKPLAEEIASAVDPLSRLRRMDVPDLKKKFDVGVPVYSESEIKEYTEREAAGPVEISQLEDINATVVWEFPREFPQGAEPLDPVIRSAAAVKLGTRSEPRSGLKKGRFTDVLFGTRRGLLVGLNGADGSEVFTQDFGSAFYEPVIADVDGDRDMDIVLVFEEGRIAVLDSALKVLWSYERKEMITAPPAAIDVTGDGIVDFVFPTKSMDIVAVDGRTGFEIWRFFDAESETMYPPIGVDINGDLVKDVVFVTMQGFLYALDGGTGWGLWKGNIQGRPAGSPALGRIGGKKEHEIYSLTRKGLLSAHSREGKLLFTSDMKTSFTVPPSVGDTDGDGKEEIVMMDVNGVIRAVEGASRREKWAYNTESGPGAGRIALADINFDGGMDVVCSTLSGVIFIIDGKTGAVAGLHNYGSSILSTPILSDLNGDGVFEIVAGTYGGVVSAVRPADARKKALSFKKSSWSSANRDRENTGYSPIFYRMLWN